MTFPVGDWFLGVGDGGIGREKVPPLGSVILRLVTMGAFFQDNPAKGALIMKGPAGCHQFARKIRVRLEGILSMDSLVLFVEGCEMNWKTFESHSIFVVKNICGKVSLILVIIWTVVVRVAV